MLGLIVTSTAAAENCFRRADNKNLKFKVYQIAPPPEILGHDYPDSSPLYPATGYLTNDIKSLNTTSPSSESGFVFEKGYLLSINHCLFMQGLTPRPEACHNTTNVTGNAFPNDAGFAVKPMFSTLTRANTCTRLQALRALGGDTGKIEDAAKDDDLKLWDIRDRKELAKLSKTVTLANGKSANYLVDVCVLEDMSQAPDASGIMLNDKSPDARTPEQMADFLRVMKNATRPYGKQLWLMGVAPTHDILFQVDGLVIDNMKTRLPSEPDLLAKVWFSTNPSALNLSGAGKLRDEVIHRGFSRLLLSSSSSGACDQPKNQVIACLALGACDGKFRGH